MEARRDWVTPDYLSGDPGHGVAGENCVAVTPSKLKRLSKINEEGFVITFWRTKDDVYPQRVKVKLEDYVKYFQTWKQGRTPGIDSPSRVSLSRSSAKLLINGPSSPDALVNTHTTHRLSIPSMK